jgi:acyl transferase domain-containing protein/NADPH:quinone reductase-like Zn-dependent oxidoreductase/SAM-dependent methyltransferase
MSEPTDPGMTPLKRAFLALEDMRARLAAAESAQREPVAVIGLGCRVPGGGDDAASFWSLLRDGVDAIGGLPRDRWDVDALYDPDPETPGRIAARGGGFLADVRGFDPALFGITRREAMGMDPQQRLLLEVAWEALEHAGQAPDRLQGSTTGVYIGVAGSDYANLQLQSGDKELIDAHFASGIAHSIVSGRLSYLLGLQGPALTIDTACSSSLVAVHLACQALRSGDCRMALAGGVNLILSPDLYIALSRARMLAPDGRCKAFDAAADGFARGEGCGVIVLKRLADAQADGDRVLAVILGSAVNQDGPSSGLTAPNGPAQEAVIRCALERAGVAPGEVGYIEAHGTGTQLGDPLEVRALGNVFGAARSESQPLWIGSVKTNVGHLEAAAGVTGLIKLVLSLQHGAIAPHLHFRQPSPHIAWDELPLKVPVALMPWEPIGGRRIGGVSAFGFSGTNAHVVVEAAPAPAGLPPARVNAPRTGLFVLSAHSEAALAAHARRCADSFEGLGDDLLPDLCFSAAVGRAHLPHRVAVLADSIAMLRERLHAVADGRDAAGVRRGRTPRRDAARVAFLFTGQGAQHVGMARQLDHSQPVFRAALDRCAAVLDPLLGVPLRELLFADGAADRLDQTGYTQPALFALEYALAELLRHWGVRADALIGHSLGEYVAACVAGVFALDDALALVAERGRLMQALPPGGAMAAVFAPEAAVAAALSAESRALSIAAQNGAAQTVIAGAAAAVDRVCAAFAASGVRCQRLPVSHAFHSPLVEPMLDAFEAAVARTRRQPPGARIVSNVSGKLLGGDEVRSTSYWRRHVREPVRFADGLRTLAQLKPDACVEIGPHPTLLTLAQAAFDGFDDAPRLIPTLHKGRDDDAQIADTLAALYLAGAAIDWRAVWSAQPCRRIDLPSYPFQREPLWFAARPARAVGGHDSGHPLLGVRLRSAQRRVVQFEQVLHADSLPFFDHHRVLGEPILPATGFIEAALAAGSRALGTAVELRELALLEPLRLEDGVACTVQALVSADGGAGASFELASCTDADSAQPSWRRHAECQLQPAGPAPVVEPLDTLRGRCRDSADVAQHHADLAARGLVFGASLRGLQRLHTGTDEALGDVVLPEPAISGRGDYLIHPALLDACLQTLAAALAHSAHAQAAAGRAYLPMAIERVLLLRSPGNRVTAHARLQAAAGAASPRMLRGDVAVYDAQGLVAIVQGIALRAADAGASSAELPLYEVAWPPEADDGDARWLPTPVQLHQQAGAQLPALLAEHGMDAYQQAFVALESLCGDWLARTFIDLGWQPRVGQTVQAEALAQQLGVVPRYHRLLARLLDILAEDGLLTAQRPLWQVARPLAAPQRDALMQRGAQLQREHPSSTARIAFTERCAPVLADVLLGRVDPLQVLFPGGSSELAETLYRDAPEARAYNQLVRDTVLTQQRALPAGRRLRILEVGGGTGGTTAWVAPALDAQRVDYLFTDVGALLVQRAREKFGGHGFMRFQTFDLEQPPAAQGIADGAFDVIIAANVVHATRDLRQTLQRLRSLLVPGGELLMLEVAGFERWIDISFGLTDGWWGFRDTALRADYPLLSRSAWLQLLETMALPGAVIGAPDARSREVLLAARRAPDQPAAGGHWLLIGGPADASAALGAELQRGGAQVSHVPDGLLDDAGALAARIAAAARTHPLTAVVHLAALRLDAMPDAGTESLLPGQQHALGSLLTLTQALGTCSFDEGKVPRLVIVTRGAVVLDAPSDLAAPQQASVMGLGKTIALEHPELRALRIDLDPTRPAALQAGTLAERLRADGREDQIAWRDGGWRAARLLPCRPTAADDTVLRLDKGSGGVFDELHLRPLPRRAPGPGEVEIRVVAAGLNFRDVMNAVALRDDPEPLGGECAGRIVAVGSGVEGFAPGDHVVALAEAAFATHAVASARLVRHIPDGIGFAAAVTLPFTFMTALHALHTLAGLSSGQSVLIHAGAGGVGMAAIQLARAVGARIFSTAGTPAKRERLLALGVEQVFDSRSLAFADGVMAATQGRGVDVVLNSLSGDFIGASVACLSERGTFLEIGKRDIWSPERFRGVRPAGRYHAIDLARMRLHDPDATSALFDDVLTRVRRGTLQPLPMHCFDMRRAADAFRFMAAGRHVGKVVLTLDDAHAASLRALQPGATYLVTGGLSGLGLLTAQRLVERGARHLILVGRRAPGAAATSALETMRKDGAQVQVAQADIAQPAEVARVLALVDPQRPLRGIVHSAGLLEDGALLQQDWPRFARPLGPKVDGAWALHAQTAHLRLDFFVLYSSMASVLGSAGQGNHAAANAFMDTLALQRRAAGLPALSISWGAWSEVGAAAERRVDERIDAQGIEAIAPAHGLELLETLMAAAPTAHVAVFPARWSAFLAQPAAAAPMLDTLRALQRTATRRAPPAPAPAPAAAAGVADEWLAQLQQATPARRHEAMLSFVGEQVARVIDAAGADAIDPRQPLNELGLDSLMAVELRNRLGSGLRLQRSLPATLVFDHPTLDALATYLTQAALPGVAAVEATPAPEACAPADAVDTIDGLSDEEIERLFAEKLRRP